MSKKKNSRRRRTNLPPRGKVAPKKAEPVVDNPPVDHEKPDATSDQEIEQPAEQESSLETEDMTSEADTKETDSEESESPSSDEADDEQSESDDEQDDPIGIFFGRLAPFDPDRHSIMNLRVGGLDSKSRRGLQRILNTLQHQEEKRTAGKPPTGKVGEKPILDYADAIRWICNRAADAPEIEDKS